MIVTTTDTQKQISKRSRTLLQQAKAIARGAAGGPMGGAAGAAVGATAEGAPFSAAGAGEEPKTVLPPSCATDDGDFERMMAKLDQLERQEAAAAGRTSAAGQSSSYCCQTSWKCLHHACM